MKNCINESMKSMLELLILFFVSFCFSNTKNTHIKPPPHNAIAIRWFWQFHIHIEAAFVNTEKERDSEWETDIHANVKQNCHNYSMHTHTEAQQQRSLVLTISNACCINCKIHIVRKINPALHHIFFSLPHHSLNKLCTVNSRI